MTRYNGNDIAGPGIYFNFRHLSFASLDEESRLPGPETDTWRNVPALFMLIVAPVIGGAFALFLPLIGFVLIGALMTRWAARIAATALSSAGRAARPVWQPALAFLSRGRRGETKSEKPAAEDSEWADEVRRQLDENDK